MLAISITRAISSRLIVTSSAKDVMNRPLNIIIQQHHLLKRFTSPSIPVSRAFSIYSGLLSQQKYSAKKVLKKTNEIRDKALGKTKQITDKTWEKSVQTYNKSKELKESIVKIIPPEVHENIYTIPNILTFTRIATTPIIGYLIVKGESNWALGFFVYSAITDFLDGFIARKYNLQSVVGSVLDPLADKALMIICTFCLAKVSAIPIYLAALILGRDIILFLAAIVIRWISLPPPKTFLRYWDVSIVTAEVRPNMISKVNTGLQMVYIGSMVIKPVLIAHLGPDATGLVLNLLQGLEWTVACTTILSGLSYVFKNGVKIIKPPNTTTK